MKESLAAAPRSDLKTSQLSASEKNIYEKTKTLLSFESIEDFYSFVAKNYDEKGGGPLYAFFNDQLLDLLKIEPAMECLDLACGTGETSLALARRVPQGKIRAVDISSGMIAAAREKLRRQGLSNVEYSVRDALDELQRLPDKSVDLILSCFALHYLDTAKVFDEMRRVLRPDGRIGIATSSLHTLAEWQGLFFDIVAQNPELAQACATYQLPSLPVSSEDFKDWLAKAGLSPVEVVTRHKVAQFSTFIEGVHYLIRTGMITEYFYRMPMAVRYFVLDEIVERGYRLCAQGQPPHSGFEILLAFTP